MIQAKCYRNILIQFVVSTINIIKYLMNKIKREASNIIKKLLQQLDFFSTECTLRFKNKPYSTNLFFGFLCAVLISLFAVLLVNTLISSFKMEQNTFSFTEAETINLDMNQEGKIENFMLGVSFRNPPGMKTINFHRIFTIKIIYWSHEKQRLVTQLMVPCLPSHWSKLKKEFNQYLYRRHLIYEFLCPKNPMNFTVTSPNQKLFTIRMEFCDSSLISNCFNSLQIQNQYVRMLNVDLNSFRLWVYSMTQSASVLQQEPIQYNVHIQNFFSLGNQTLVIDQAFDRFIIETDKNFISVFQDVQTRYGYFLGRRYLTRKRDSFIKDKIILQYNGYSSPKIYIYHRSVYKTDDVISYIGGLFGLFLVIFSFFLKNYNRISYQLKVAEAFFHFDEHGNKIGQNLLNAYTYLKYSIIKWLQLLFCTRMHWKDTQLLGQTLQQSNQILDARKIFRRLQYIQSVIWRRNDHKYLLAMTLTSPISIKQARMKRKILGYNQEIVGSQKQLALKDLVSSGQKILQNQQSRSKAPSISKIEQLQQNINPTIQFIRPNQPKEDQLFGSSCNLYNTLKQQQMAKPDNNKQIKQLKQRIQGSLRKQIGLTREVSHQIAEYQKIAVKASEKNLDQQWNQSEKQIAKSFLKLDAQQKKQILLHMPLVIIHRLRMRVYEIRTQHNTPNQLVAQNNVGLRREVFRKNLIRLAYGIKNGVSNFLYQMDMFFSQLTFRSKRQSQKSSFKFGILNFIFIGIFAYVLIQGIVEMIQLHSNQMIITSHKQFLNDTGIVNNVMLAVKFPTLKQTQDYKPEILSSGSYVFGQAIFRRISVVQFLSPCKSENWRLLGSNYREQFQIYGLSEAYCLSKLYSNLSTSDQRFWLSLYFSRCYNISSFNKTDCKEFSEVNNYIQNVVKQYKYFPVQIFILSPYIQADSPEPIKYQIVHKRFFPTLNHSIYSLQTYTLAKIRTDRSIWPFVQEIQQTQIIVPDYTRESLFRFDLYNSSYTDLIEFNCKTDPQVLIIQRKVRKIDDILSYIGGIFGFILIFFNFFLGTFNEYRYQLSVGESSFNYDSNGNKMTQKKFNALSYVKVQMFKFISCFYSTKQRETILINETLEQAGQVLDAQKFFRKLQFMEQVIWSRQDPNYLRCLAVTRDNNLREIRMKRHILQYFEQIVKQQEAATGEDAINQTKQSFRYLEGIYRSYGKQKQLEVLQQVKNSELNNTTQKLLQMPKKLIVKVKQQMEEIKVSLMNDLQLPEDVSSKICQYPIISFQARNIKLEQHFQTSEKLLTFAFMNLRQEQKVAQIMKIPIIIIHRLRLRVQLIKGTLPSKSFSKPQSLNDQSIVKHFAITDYTM